MNTSDVEGTKTVEEEQDTATEDSAEQEALPEDTDKEESAEEAQAETDAEAQVAQDVAAQAQNQAGVAAAPDINFTESSLMEWPVNGQVVLDYNMDNTVYFPTLNVYKLNPAVAISAEVGAPVAAVANGKIVSVLENEETGTTVTVDMGNGYQAVYGQLKDVPFQAEEYVTAGAVLGYINEPTKYYTEEGANLYFALSKDGVSLDPMEYLP